MNSLNNVTVVGLTGQSGSGKTTVSNCFVKNGFSVINADNIARQITTKGNPCLKNIFDVFPECIDCETGELNRKKLACIVFNDKDLLKLLNSIMYPYITTKILNQIRKLSASGKKLILLDAPTLFESHTDDFCNFIVSVIADKNVRFDRISKRDNISSDEIESRFSSQYDDDFYISRSDIVIKNDSTLDELNRKAVECVNKIKELFNA